MATLQFDDVTVAFRRTTAVNRVSLTVPSGATVGIVGESGSGKSTLARAAVGLAPLHGGRVLLDGQEVRHGVVNGERPIQMVFQDPYSSLDPRMSIRRSIAEALPKTVPRGSRDDEVARFIDLVELTRERLDDRPHQLSGGQRQRVALARALAAHPRVVIADEITSALDVSVQGAVLNLLRDLQEELRLTIMFISHNLSVVRYVSDYVGVMYQGEIVEFGPAEQVYAEPEHPYTKTLLAAAPTMAASRG